MGKKRESSRAKPILNFPSTCIFAFIPAPFSRASALIPSRPSRPLPPPKAPVCTQMKAHALAWAQCTIAQRSHLSPRSIWVLGPLGHRSHLDLRPIWVPVQFQTAHTFVLPSQVELWRSSKDLDLSVIVYFKVCLSYMAFQRFRQPGKFSYGVWQ